MESQQKQQGSFDYKKKIKQLKSIINLNEITDEQVESLVKGLINLTGGNEKLNLVELRENIFLDISRSVSASLLTRLQDYGELSTLVLAQEHIQIRVAADHLATTLTRAIFASVDLQPHQLQKETQKALKKVRR